MEKVNLTLESRHLEYSDLVDLNISKFLRDKLDERMEKDGVELSG